MFPHVLADPNTSQNDTNPGLQPWVETVAKKQKGGTVLTVPPLSFFGESHTLSLKEALTTRPVFGAYS